jgi:hypothetical protein
MTAVPNLAEATLSEILAELANRYEATVTMVESPHSAGAVGKVLAEREEIESRVSYTGGRSRALGMMISALYDVLNDGSPVRT